MKNFISALALIAFVPAMATASEVTDYEPCLKTFLRSDLMIRLMQKRGEDLPAVGLAAFERAKEDYFAKGIRLFGHDKMVEMARLGEDDTIAKNEDLNLIANTYIDDGALEAFNFSAALAARCASMDSDLVAYVLPYLEKSRTSN